MKRRMHGALVGVMAAVMGAGALLAGGGAAGAATPAAATAGAATTAAAAGKVTLTARGDSLTDESPFTGVSVDKACPAGYQDNLSVYLVVPDGRESSIAFALTDGGPFATRPITAREPATSTQGTFVNSIADAFDNASVPVADGTYPIHVVCGNADQADFPQRPTFTGFITVTGDTWHVASLPAPAATTIRISAAPAGHVLVGQPFTLSATVAPRVAGTVQFAADNGVNPIGDPVPVSGGVASVQAPAAAYPSVRNYTATFVPADQIGHAQAYGLFDYTVVNAPTVTVKDASGTALGGTPQLTRGQHVTVSATGLRPSAGEPVAVAIPGAHTAFPDAASDAAGSVTDYPLTVPDCLGRGTHRLTLTGRDTRIKITLTFTVKR